MNKPKPALRIIAVCSLCGHQYATWANSAEAADHMREDHGMVIDPHPRWKPARKGPQ